MVNVMRGDVFDIREVIERFEELESLIEDGGGAEHADEIAVLTGFLGNVAGNGGDEKWRGDWYPLIFIRDSHFEEYAREYAEDTGSLDRDAKWPQNCIDWAQAAHELQADYSSTEIDGTTYWYR